MNSEGLISFVDISVTVASSSSTAHVKYTSRDVREPRAGAQTSETERRGCRSMGSDAELHGKRVTALSMIGRPNAY